MTIETKELVISNELKRKVEMICKFAYVEYSFANGSIISLKNTNIAHVKPHILKIKDNGYLILFWQKFKTMLSWIYQENLHKIKREYLTLPSWVLAHIYGKALNLC